METCAGRRHGSSTWLPRQSGETLFRFVFSGRWCFNPTYLFFIYSKKHAGVSSPLFTFPVLPRLCFGWKLETQHQKRFRNFPNDAARGEHLLRKGYEAQMERLGVLVDDGGLVVDLGCGSGTSTRCVRPPASLPSSRCSAADSSAHGRWMS